MRVGGRITRPPAQCTLKQLRWHPTAQVSLPFSMTLIFGPEENCVKILLSQLQIRSWFSVFSVIATLGAALLGSLLLLRDCGA